MDAKFSKEAILKPYDYNPAQVERVRHRPPEWKPPLAIVDPNPQWPHLYQSIADGIRSVLGPTLIKISHVGSTSIPNMPAKDVIDIDLTVVDPLQESTYVPQLEAIGFLFLAREPAWNEHRFFCAKDPISTNLHVWGPGCPEVERHQIFRNWLLQSPDDHALYARTKRECAEQSNLANEDVMDYNLRKQDVVRDILNRAFRDMGYLS